MVRRFKVMSTFAGSISGLIFQAFCIIPCMLLGGSIRQQYCPMLDMTQFVATQYSCDRMKIRESPEVRNAQVLCIWLLLSKCLWFFLERE